MYSCFGICAHWNYNYVVIKSVFDLDKNTVWKIDFFFKWVVRYLKNNKTS